MITDGKPGPHDALEEIRDAIEELGKREQPAPVVNVNVPVPKVSVAAANVHIPEPRPCEHVAYDLVIVSRDRDGRIQKATLTPIKS